MVVVPAEQHPVVDIGRAACVPGHNMVHFGPLGWGAAAGDDAAAVAGGDGSALGPVEEPAFPAEGEDAPLVAR